MEIPKPTEQDRAYFFSLVPSDPLVEVKPMFGNLGAFVNGNMFMGLFGADVGVKLDEADQAALLSEKGAGPFGPEGHSMPGYVVLPAVWRSSPAEAEGWVVKAFAAASELPPKAKAPKKSTGAKEAAPGPKTSSRTSKPSPAARKGPGAT